MTKKLIQQLLQSDRRADQTALRLFEKACRRAQRRAPSNRSSGTKGELIDADVIAAKLERLLRRGLSGVDLTDPIDYQAVLTTIDAWQPRCQAAALQHCGFVQNGLLALLPRLKRWQQLNRLCQDYQKHLRDQQPLIFSLQPVAAPTLLSVAGAASDRRRDPTTTTLDQETDLVKITQKIKAVAEMQLTLQTRQDVTTQCQAFQTVFQKNRRVIEKDRDSLAMMFVKAVVTVFSLGLAAMLGIWSVKGKKTAQKIEATLYSPVSSEGSTEKNNHHPRFFRRNQL
jgi:hypothetical protein